MNLALVLKRIDAYERLIRLDKPAGALLLLWPTLWAVWIAAYGQPSAAVVIIFVAGTFLMRSAGCAVNDFADRKFDPHVERTRRRPVAAGEIAPGEALAVGAALAAIAFCFVLFLDRFAILLSFVALAIAASYPFAKRVFDFPQLYLGVAFGFGIPMAYAAIRGQLPMECWALLAANVFYAFAYDTIYAMVDRDDDLKIGVRSSAIALGRLDVAAVMGSYAAMLALLAGAGAVIWRFGWPYFVGIAAAAGMAGSLYPLIRGRSREGCWRAFVLSNWVGAVVLAGIVASYQIA